MRTRRDEEEYHSTSDLVYLDREWYPMNMGNILNMLRDAILALLQSLGARS